LAFDHLSGIVLFIQGEQWTFSTIHARELADRIDLTNGAKTCIFNPGRVFRFHISIPTGVESTVAGALVAVDTIRAYAPRAIVLVTLGGDGVVRPLPGAARCTCGSRLMRIPAMPIANSELMAITIPKDVRLRRLSVIQRLRRKTRSTRRGCERGTPSPLLTKLIMEVPRQNILPSREPMQGIERNCKVF
jgi:hypothetical protein